MTPKEAIRILHPDTTREALSGMDAETAIPLVEEACRMACEALEKHIEIDADAQMNRESICSGCVDEYHCEWFCGGECYEGNEETQ